ncbi:MULTISPECIES: YabP/YqfC family sporulation protein [Coprobacillaceae]|uniref:YabP/YqfC family sporulation protein n=1 Tax=Coprobacillaceae TaxID=2810280 RepID=UPI000E52B631|nr:MULTISPECIES: YabP/YqfC family sporulation protein [Coprobacillaceae]RHM60624.1 hypothetical protein DWZ53_06860 [Coprobacillus sp. AF33-1AC]RHS93270.1 hypothetical protein DW911_06665 [Erysipelatoclostridium sp. AM42-17]
MIYIQHNRILIKYYQSIITLEDCLLEIKMNDSIIKIMGQDLQIQYYSFDEILVRGQLKQIIFT